jgi:glycosyltransferase involved in cell wall biosynthesis
LGNRIVIARKNKLSNREIEEMFLRSRIAIGLSMSDGLPATVKEAMCTGVFPVQTDTSCAGEWFKPKLGGFLVPPNKVSVAAAAVLLALKDNQLVDNAMIQNLAIAESRFSAVIVREMARKTYLDEENSSEK